MTSMGPNGPEPSEHTGRPLPSPTSGAVAVDLAGVSVRHGTVAAVTGGVAAGPRR